MSLTGVWEQIFQAITQIPSTATNLTLLFWSMVMATVEKYVSDRCDNSSIHEVPAMSTICHVSSQVMII